MAALQSEVEAGYPTEAPPVDVYRTCFPIERTHRVVDTLVEGDWHPQLGPTELNPGPDWSVLAPPEMGGNVEVWISEDLPNIDAHLGTALGSEVELVRLVIGEDLSKGWAGTRAVETTAEIEDTPSTSIQDESPRTNTLDDGQQLPPPSNGARVPGVLWWSLGLLAIGLGTWGLRRRG